MYGTQDSQNGITDHFPAVQITEENLRRLNYMTDGAIIDDRLTWAGRGRVETAKVGDWIISDMAGNYKAADKEVFEISFVRVV